ncbi:MAG TPA: hypothetical protein VNH53_05345 [Sphingomicrobium sp.]|nr:hypothetical protein [Sphingomicrobium sp.]
MLRREYHIAVIASRLESAHSKDAATLNDLRAAAASILDKAGLNTERDVGEERRSKDEERLVNAARQGWHQALKGAGVLAVDRRGGGHNRTRAAGRSLFRRLYRLKRGELLADEGAELLVNYARWRLYQLLELFEEVEQASPGYIRDDVRSMGKTLRTLIK